MEGKYPWLLQWCKLSPRMSVWEKLFCCWIQRDWWFWQTLWYVLEPKGLFIHLDTRGKELQGYQSEQEIFDAKWKRREHSSVFQHSTSLSEAPLLPTLLWGASIQPVKWSWAYTLLHHSVPWGMASTASCVLQAWKIRQLSLFVLAAWGWIQGAVECGLMGSECDNGVCLPRMAGSWEGWGVASWAEHQQC